MPWILQRLADLDDATTPPTEEYLAPISKRLEAIARAAGTNALAGLDIIAAVLPGGKGGSRSLSVSDTGWTSALEGDIQRARSALLGVDDARSRFDV